MQKLTKSYMVFSENFDVTLVIAVQLKPMNKIRAKGVRTTIY